MATTSSAEHDVGRESASVETPAFYMALLLEDALAGGHKASYETIRDLLTSDAHRKAWTPAMFMRCGGDALAVDLLDRVVDVLEMSAPEAEMFKSQYAESYPSRLLSQAPEKVPTALMNWFEEARKRQGKVLAFSLLPVETANTLFAKLRLDAAAVAHEQLPNNIEMPLAKRFVRLARRLKVAPSRIVLVATGPIAARAGLEAGFQCVAVPNELAGFADFTGCQVVLDQFGDRTASELFDALFPKMEPAGKR